MKYIPNPKPPVRSIETFPEAFSMSFLAAIVYERPLIPAKRVHTLCTENRRSNPQRQRMYLYSRCVVPRQTLKTFLDGVIAE